MQCNEGNAPQTTVRLESRRNGAALVTINVENE